MFKNSEDKAVKETMTERLQPWVKNSSTQLHLFCNANVNELAKQYSFINV